MTQSEHVATVPTTPRRRFHQQLGALSALPLMPIARLAQAQSVAAQSVAAHAGAAHAGASSSDPAAGPRTPPSLLAPGEEHAHLLTYMAFASDADEIWTEPSGENAGLARVRADLIDIAKAIGSFEPVTMFVLSDEERGIAQGLLDRASPANPDVHRRYLGRAQGTGGIRLVVTPDGFNDYWTRDTAPVFVHDAARRDRLLAINFRFNGWGNANSQDGDAPDSSNETKKASFYQPFENDQKMARAIAMRHDAQVIDANLTLEGGALEWDGEGTAIVTASSVLHVNRNPQLFDLTMSGSRVTGARLKADARTRVEAELRRLLGVTKVIWLTGTASFPTVGVEAETDITNGHVDFYAKFLAPGVVAYAFDPGDAMGERAITARHKQELTDQMDAQGRPLTLVPLNTPRVYGTGLTQGQKADFAAGYINGYFCNGAFILPRFGDTAADQAAVAAVAPHVGRRVIVQVDVTGIGSGGGGLHCATSQVPA